MSENTAWKWLRENLKGKGRRLQRIENIVGSGMPDINGCFNGREFWIEVKAPKEPKRPSTPLFGSNHKVSQEQKNWFMEQRQSGGRGYLFIDTDQRRILIDGKFADDINTMTADEICDKSLWVAGKPMRNGEALIDLLVDALEEN